MPWSTCVPAVRVIPKTEVLNPLKLRSIFGGIIPLFVLGHFSHHIMTAITVPLIPFIRSAFSLDYAQSGFVVSAFSLSYGIAQLPAGWPADRIDPRKMMTISISGVALVGIMVGLSQTYVPLILFLILMGFLAGGYHPSAPPLILAAAKKENLGRALGFHNIGGSVSNSLTPLVAVAAANALGWRNAYIALAIPMAAFGILFYVRLGRLTIREKAGAGHGQKMNDRTQDRPGQMRYLVIFLSLSTFSSALIPTINSFLPLLMVDHFGTSKEIAAGALTVLYSTGLWANPLGGYIADRMGSVRVILGVCFIAGPAIFLVTVLPIRMGAGSTIHRPGVHRLRPNVCLRGLHSQTGADWRTVDHPRHILLLQPGGRGDLDAGCGLPDRPLRFYRGLWTGWRRRLSHDAGLLVRAVGREQTAGSLRSMDSGRCYVHRVIHRYLDYSEIQNRFAV
jgi:MFS family permease